MRKTNGKTAALMAAFPKTLPVMAGYLLLGTTYGIYMNVSGFAWYYPTIMAIVIYGGSLEFVCVEMLMSAFAPLQTFLIAFMIQARHLFYGLTLLEKYKNTGMKKFYMIFTLSDETFAVVSGMETPENIDRGWYYFFVSLLDQCYWVIGATLGSLLGSLITFPTEGLEFVMTAMFIAIFTDRFMKEKKHYSSFIGLCAALCWLVLCGPDNFIIPTMITMLVMLVALRKPVEKGQGVL